MKGCKTRFTTRRLLLSTLLVLLLSQTAWAASDSSIPRPADPYADPKDDVYNPLRYIASNTLTAIAFSLFMAVGLTETYETWRQGAVWMLSMVIGEYTYSIGLALRFGLHYNPESRGIYIAEYLFITLSPCAFIAADYVLLGRLARYLRCDEHLLVRPTRITIVFISSDITTFLIQAAGGGLATSVNPDSALAGSRIFLAGLALQLLSFFLFTCVYARFLWRVYKTERTGAWVVDAQAGKGWYADWRALAGALGVSCVGILVRSVYRTIELSQGFAGPIATNEGLFYGLDALPLFVAVSIYVFLWPGRFIPRLDPPVRKEVLGREAGDSVDGEKRDGEA